MLFILKKENYLSFLNVKIYLWLYRPVIINIKIIFSIKRIIISGTVAEGAPVIPISAQLKYNIEVICEYAVKKIPVPLRDFTSEPRLIGIYIFFMLVFFITMISCL